MLGQGPEGYCPKMSCQEFLSLCDQSGMQKGWINQLFKCPMKAFFLHFFFLLKTAFGSVLLVSHWLDPHSRWGFDLVFEYFTFSDVWGCCKCLIRSERTQTEISSELLLDYMTLYLAYVWWNPSIPFLFKLSFLLFVGLCCALFHHPVYMFLHLCLCMSMDVPLKASYSHKWIMMWSWCGEFVLLWQWSLACQGPTACLHLQHKNDTGFSPSCSSVVPFTEQGFKISGCLLKSAFLTCVLVYVKLLPKCN